MEYAIVTGGFLNMRSDKDTNSTRITRIPNKSNVAVIEKEPDWCKVVYNEYTGYVMAKFLEFESDSENEKITISISKDCAKELYDALKLSLKS